MTMQTLLYRALLLERGMSLHHVSNFFSTCH